MKTVQPIRDPQKIKEMAAILKSQSQEKYILFQLGIYSGLRISDIINLRVKDLKNKTHFTLYEGKTGKEKYLAINPSLKKELDKYLLPMDDNDFVIGSREYREYLPVKVKTKNPKTGKIKTTTKMVKNIASNSPITRETAWKIFSDVSKAVGLENIGAHSLRKTFAYHLYLQTDKNIGLVQDLLNHDSPKVTLRYIGILQDDMDSAVCAMDFGL